jgi:uncharacterized OB-fold protein
MQGSGARTLHEVKSDPRPIPELDELSTFFWEGARKGLLLVQRCSACLRFQYPPDVVCVSCQCLDMTPTAVSGRGVLYSFAIVDRPFHAGFVEAVPYVVALVELAEQSGLKMLTNLVGADPAGLLVGMPVEVTFEDTGRVVLPEFRPSGESS